MITYLSNSPKNTCKLLLIYLIITAREQGVDWPWSGSRTFWTRFGHEPDPMFRFGFMDPGRTRPQLGSRFSTLGEPKPEVRTRTSEGSMIPHLAFLLPFPPLFETTSIAFNYQHRHHHNVKSVNSTIHFCCLLTHSSPFFQHRFPDLAPTLAGLFFRYYCLAIGSVRI